MFLYITLGQQQDLWLFYPVQCEFKKDMRDNWNQFFYGIEFVISENLPFVLNDDIGKLLTTEITVNFITISPNT